MNAISTAVNFICIVSGMFPQAMNYLVMSFLYDQFNKLSEEFSKCIGDQGEFSGNFEQFRRRHQAISRSVQQADRFLKISNVATFCCEIVSIILILYSVIFFRGETVSLSLEGAFAYIYWLGINIFILCLAAGLPIIVNHAVSLYHTYNFDDCMLMQSWCIRHMPVAPHFSRVAAWRSSNVIGRIIDVTLHRAGLLRGPMAVLERANHLCVPTATQANSASYPTQSGNEYRPKCGDDLQVETKGRMAHSIRGSTCGWQVKLCDASLTHANLSALQVSTASVYV